MASNEALRTATAAWEGVGVGSIHRASLEANLARAHRAISSAKQNADDLADDGMYLDLQMIEVEIVRLAEASLKDRKLKGSVVPGRMLRGA